MEINMSLTYNYLHNIYICFFQCNLTQEYGLLKFYT